MKKLFFGTMLLALVIVVPIPTMAAVDVHISFPLPPPIVFPAPPQVIVVPETNVYVDPDIDVDLFFWNGWWWRLWEGRWYRARFYNRGWAYYSSVPSFYFDVDPGWRRYYREHLWYGHRWNYERIPYNRLEKNWKSWQENRHWERRGTSWGVQDYQPRPRQERQELKQQWQREYHQKPEVQRHQEQIQKQQRKPEVRKQERKPEIQKQERRPEFQKQERKPEVQKQERKPEVQPQGKESQHQREKPRGGEQEHVK